jgi:hypothetical protein
MIKNVPKIFWKPPQDTDKITDRGPVKLLFYIKSIPPFWVVLVSQFSHIQIKEG